MTANTEKTTTTSNGEYTKKIQDEIKKMSKENPPEFLAGFLAGMKFVSGLMAGIK